MPLRWRYECRGVHAVEALRGAVRYERRGARQKRSGGGTSAVMRSKSAPGGGTGAVARGRSALWCRYERRGAR